MGEILYLVWPIETEIDILEVILKSTMVRELRVMYLMIVGGYTHLLEVPDW